jgi:TonB family protein
MNLQKNQALWTSVIIHLVVLLGLFLGAVVDFLKPKEKEHVFQMVSPPASHSVASPTESPAMAQPLETPQMPDLAPVPQITLPQPAPPPVPQSQPVPAPRATPTPPKPTPAPPKPAPTPARVSYADFIKQNPIKQPVQRQPPSKVSIAVPKIDTSKVQESLRGLLQNQSRVDPGMSETEQDALTQYGARLNAQLNRAWQKPSSLAGVRLVATVVFDVSSSGRISNVRPRPASGNSAFDASVLAAFRQVAGIGATPTGSAHTFTMSFRMVE